MDNTREKLIELLKEVQYQGNAVHGYHDRYIQNSELADHLIANGVTLGSKWIPVTERLPESYKLVLAVCKSGKIFVGEYVDLGWRTLWRIKTARDSTKEITQIVTHWMPLPEPPKGEE